MPGSRRTLTGIAAIAAATGLSVGPSYADSGNGDGGGSIPVNERPNGVTISLSSTTQTPYKPGAGNTGGTWTAPPCWYGPLGDDAAFQKTLENYNFLEHHTDPNRQDWPDFGTWYDGFWTQMVAHETDKPPGTWYQSTCADYSSSVSAAWLAANPDFVYVPAQGPAPNLPVIDPKTLAQYALASAILPKNPPTFAPAAGAPSVVNLATWAWQADGKTRDLTASLVPQAATVLMTPISMTLTTDGPTAGGIPNVCQKSGDTIGVVYAGAQNNPAAPGCGLEFSVPGTYNVTADVTWQITWTSPQVAGVQTLPDIHMTTTTPITAQEIQTVNTGH